MAGHRHVAVCPSAERTQELPKPHVTLAQGSRDPVRWVGQGGVTKPPLRPPPRAPGSACQARAHRRARGGEGGCGAAGRTAPAAARTRCCRWRRRSRTRAPPRRDTRSSCTRRRLGPNPLLRARTLHRSHTTCLGTLGRTGEGKVRAQPPATRPQAPAHAVSTHLQRPRDALGVLAH